MTIPGRQSHGDIIVTIYFSYEFVGTKVRIEGYSLPDESFSGLLIIGYCMRYAIETTV